MSQVTTPHDKFSKGRDRTKTEESSIDRETVFRKWRRNDISKGYDPFAKIVGVALLPIFGIWSLLTAIAAVSVWLAVAVSRVLGSAFKVFEK